MGQLNEELGAVLARILLKLGKNDSLWIDMNSCGGWDVRIHRIAYSRVAVNHKDIRVALERAEENMGCE